MASRELALYRRLLGEALPPTRLAELLPVAEAILAPIADLRGLDLTDVHPAVVFDPGAPSPVAGVATADEPHRSDPSPLGERLGEGEPPLGAMHVGESGAPKLPLTFPSLRDGPLLSPRGEETGGATAGDRVPTEAPDNREIWAQ